MADEHRLEELLEFLRKEGVPETLVDGVRKYRADYPVPPEAADRVPCPDYRYYGKAVWEKALAVLLTGENLLLAGPKATGKNVLAENLGLVLGRPCWNISFHINVDAAYLIGSDTFDGSRVVFRPGPVTLCARNGGIGILDEINMAKNEALAVLHETLDFRREIEIPGYDRIPLDPACRFIGTMNYGYAGTREMNEALTSRFAVLDMPVIDGDDLARLITDQFPTMKKSARGQFIRLFYELEKKTENAEISDRSLDLRGMLDAIRLISVGISAGDALDMCITNKTFDRYEQGLIRDVIRARIPEKLAGKDIFA